MNVGWKKNLFIGSIGTAMLVLTLSAHATIFNLSGNTSPSSSKSVTADGITLTATGQYRDGSGSWLNGNVTQTLNGYGLRFPGDNSTLLDSMGLNEYLVFAITGLGPGQRLAIDSILFGQYGSGEDFSFYVDTSLAQVGGQIIGPGFDPMSNPWQLANNLSNEARTASASFGVKVNDVGGTEAFRIQQIVAHTVPEPATLALVGLGLAGIGYQRRRKMVF